MNYSITKCNIIILGLFAVAFIYSSCKKTPETAPTPGDPATVTDVDGNVYKTIRIGTQLWIAENLRTTRYNDSSSITTGLSDNDWRDATIGAFAIYDGDNTNNTTYGKLYNWYAVNTGKLAPKGWHVPTRAEWTILVEYLGGNSVAGGKLKSTSSLWAAPNTGATNISGFSALPSGYRGVGGGYSLLSRSAYFWSSSARNTTQSDYLLLDNDFSSSSGNAATNTFGYAVRCIKD